MDTNIKYINKDKAIHAMHTLNIFRLAAGNSDICDAINVLQEMPAEERTSTWENPYAPFQCGHCKKHSDTRTDYCPHCGFRMLNAQSMDSKEKKKAENKKEET